ncbi:MAG: zinc-binding dehydrogenase [Acidobacteria bacterium]|nr:zinc-binding dehydrogenase [Acidobacteriota bacterium]
MRAIVVRRYGPPEVLEWREVPDPKPGPGQVLVRVKAVGINFADLLARLGVYSGTPKPPFVPGLEIAGVVEQAGGGSREAGGGRQDAGDRAQDAGGGRRDSAGASPAGGWSLKAGDRVVALSRFSAYAERVTVNAEQAFPIPDAMSFEEAAATPVNYLTAWQSMFEMGNLRRGDRILITSAAGGVGVAAVQLARARGLVTFGTAGPAKQEFLRQIGVDHPIDYTRENFLDVVRRIAPEGIEMALDAVGGKSYAQSYKCLGPMGRLVVYGFSTVVGPKGKINYLHGAKEMLQTPRFHPLKLIDGNIAVIGVHIGKLRHKSSIMKEQLEEIFRMYQSGQVKPVVGKTFPLPEAAAAHRYLHDRKNLGKVVLLVN